MVYCPKCGFKNEDGAEICTNCKASLQVTVQEGRRMKRRTEEECFGLPYGGVIVGLIIGIVIILWGLSQVPGILPEGFELWWLVIIIFGILIVAGSLYRLGRR
ncbi:MAG: zinc ribbon domain-containing protein [Candidatus Bathyarchaeota archaeon]|nr:MAG: zinc ribbon domain-containing protein [Candidatus Bathyarchaeota archaeon]